jgi:hypothetical protein
LHHEISYGGCQELNDGITDAASSKAEVSVDYNLKKPNCVCGGDHTEVEPTHKKE